MDKTKNIFSEKLKVAMGRKNVRYAGLSELSGTSLGCISYQIRNNNFTESAMRKYAAALGYDVEIVLIPKDGDAVVSQKDGNI